MIAIQKFNFILEPVYTHTPLHEWLYIIVNTARYPVMKTVFIVEITYK